MKASTKKVAQPIQALSLLKQQFEQWRADRRVGQRIPPALWEAAASATVVHGAYRVARELKLDYAMVKQRGAQLGASGAAPVPAPHFVELVAAQGLPISAPGSECVVEIANARGAQMRLQLRGSALASLPGLCQAFWSA